MDYMQLGGRETSMREESASATQRTSASGTKCAEHLEGMPEKALAACQIRKENINAPTSSASAAPSVPASASASVFGSAAPSVPASAAPSMAGSESTASGTWSPSAEPPIEPSERVTRSCMHAGTGRRVLVGGDQGDGAQKSSGDAAHKFSASPATKSRRRSQAIMRRRYPMLSLRRKKLAPRSVLDSSLPYSPNRSARDGPDLVAPDGPGIVAPDGPRAPLLAPDGPELVSPDGPAIVAPDGRNQVAVDAHEQTSRCEVIEWCKPDEAQKEVTRSIQEGNPAGACAPKHPKQVDPQENRVLGTPTRRQSCVGDQMSDVGIRSLKMDLSNSCINQSSVA